MNLPNRNIEGHASIRAFGFAQSLQINIQQCGLEIRPGEPFPNQIIGMIPYLLTIIVLAGAVGRSTPPAAVGVPYEK